MSDIRLTDVTKVYPNGFQAIYGLDLHVDDGEFLVLVGPSGCGKSTALRMIAGLEEITDGKLEIAGQVVNDVAPKDRDIAMVFQNYALYPHMTVAENIGFSLRLGKTPKSEITERVAEVARILELEDYLKSRPAQLSGGQRQRVAMGRAIVRQPSAFLMDEPLSNLDAKLRVQMRAEIARLQRDLGVTTVYVTHDQVEAMTMGDRVAVLKDGRLQQVDAPQQIYEHPTNVFVAAFIGSPSMNLFEGTIVAARSSAQSSAQLTVGDVTLALPDGVFADRPALRDYDGGPVVVGLRPEDLDDAAFASADLPRITLKVSLVEALGSELIVHLDLDAPQVNAGDPDAIEEIGVVGKAVGRFNPRSTAAEGETIDVAVNTANLHFFDPTTHEAI